jgi:hypothetical protein
MRFLRTAPLIAAFVLGSAGALAAPPVVVSTSPVANSMAPADTPIAITFDQALLTTTVTASTLRVFAKQTGKSTGSLAFSNATRRSRSRRRRRSRPGARARQPVARDPGRGHAPLRSAGYAFQFLIRPARHALFDEVQSMSNAAARRRASMAQRRRPERRRLHRSHHRQRGERRPARVLNRADGSGLPGLEAVRDRLESSPNETGDFDNDGKIDWPCRRRTAAACGSCAAPATQVQRLADRATGAEAHGIAVLDVDGDADLDIVTLAGANEMAVL